MLFILMTTLFSCVNLKNNARIYGVYKGEKDDRDDQLELYKDKTFCYTTLISTSPKIYHGKWYVFSKKSILLVSDSSEKNPLLWMSKLFDPTKNVVLQFEGKEKIIWEDQNYNLHELNKSSP